MRNWLLSHQRTLWYLFCTALLLAFCLQTCAALRVESATVDETIHFTRGYLYLALGDLHFKIGHPILANALNALPVWALADLNMPLDHTSWETSWSVWSDHFIWSSVNDVQLIFRLSRWVTVVMGMLTGCLIARWARELFGPLGGALALALYVFEPNILAHSHLVTDDTAVTGFTLAATYGLWRFHKTQRWPSLILSGMMLGCAQAVKFTAAVLLPLFGLLSIIWEIQHRHQFWRAATTLAAVLTIAGITVWGVYGFQIGALNEIGLPSPVPAPDYLDDLAWVIRYFDKGHGTYLMGEISTTGWWYYDLIAFAIKTPLPWLILLITAVVRAVQQRKWWPELVLPVATFLIAAIYSRLDIGLRHLLPAYPFLVIYMSQVAALPRKQQRAKRMWTVVVSLAVGWLAVDTLSIAPHYLAYFNPLIGGPTNGPLYLVDSNLDWGQALPGLRQWMTEHNVNSVYLSYFGTAHPSAYDIEFTAIPTWEAAPEKGYLFQRVFEPSNPAPGTYAISATNLFGPTVPDRKTFAWFRNRDPVARIGYAIYVYQVEPTGPPLNVALSGLQIDELSPETIARFGTNDLHLRWFDARHSLVFPAEEPSFLLMADETPLDPALTLRFAAALTEEKRWTTGDHTRAYRHYRLADLQAVKASLAEMTPSSVWWSPAVAFPPGYERYPLPLPATFEHSLTFLGYELGTDHLRPGEDLRLFTFWRVEEPFEPPLSLFVHLLDAEGQVRGQHDGLSVDPVGLEAGDVFVQAHGFAVPPDASAGEYQLEIGVYRSDTMQRWVIHKGVDAVADRLLLHPVSIKAK